MSKKIIFILIYLLLFAINSNNCQSQSKSNMYILDSLISIAAKNICYDLNSKGINQAIINFPNNSATWLIKQNIIKYADSFNLTIYTKSNNKDLPEVEININECNIKYKSLESTCDSLMRICYVYISGTIDKTDGIIKTIKSNRIKFQDRISRNDLSYINDTEFKFLNPKVPIKKRSFFEKITEPVIIIVSSAIVIILFFTVRSG